MQYYIVLAIATGIITFLGLLLWLKTKSLTFPFGLFFIYYLTLYGAWFVVYDKLGGDSGKHYAYLEEKMFRIYLDEYYLGALIIYSVFVAVLAGTALLLVRTDKSRRTILPENLKISHSPIVVICGCASILSYLAIQEDLDASVSQGVSAYVLLKRGFGDVSPWFTVHQIALRLALVPTVIGLAVNFSGKFPRLFSCEPSKISSFLYSLIIGSMLMLAFVLGYKSEIFSAGLIGGLFYLMNVRKRKIVPGLVTAGAVLFGMWSVDRFRATSFDQLYEALFNGSFSSFGEIFSFATSSNEAFAGHFSMYGVLAADVPLTYGMSLLSFVASVVPRALWPDRPGDVYTYYANAVDAVSGQGYTINHATAWYLNFGLIGVIAGAVLFGLIWAKCFNVCLRAATINNRFLRVTASIAPFTFTAYIPFLVRSGPESYKGLIIEAFLLPAIVLTLASFRWQFIPHIRRYIK